MSTDKRSELVVVPSDAPGVDMAPPFCSKHTGERFRKAWRIRGRRIWHFYWCPECDGH
jgi:hypothetical protein